MVLPSLPLVAAACLAMVASTRGCQVFPGVVFKNPQGKNPNAVNWFDGPWSGGTGDRQLKCPFAEGPMLGSTYTVTLCPTAEGAQGVECPDGTRGVTTQAVQGGQNNQNTAQWCNACVPVSARSIPPLDKP